MENLYTEVQTYIYKFIYIYILKEFQRHNQLHIECWVRKKCGKNYSSTAKGKKSIKKGRVSWRFSYNFFNIATFVSCAAAAANFPSLCSWCVVHNNKEKK